MNEDWKKVFENQPPVPYSVVSNMDDGRYDENAVLFFEETGTLGEAYRLYKINDFKDGRDTLVIPSEVNGKPVIAIIYFVKAVCLSECASLFKEQHCVFVVSAIVHV